jgi:hypothetical protein
VIGQDIVTTKDEHRQRAMELMERAWHTNPKDSGTYKYPPPARTEMILKAQVHATLALSAPSAPYVITEDTGYQ